MARAASAGSTSPRGARSRCATSDAVAWIVTRHWFFHQRLCHAAAAAAHGQRGPPSSTALLTWNITGSRFSSENPFMNPRGHLCDGLIARALHCVRSRTVLAATSHRGVCIVFNKPSRHVLMHASCGNQLHPLLRRFCMSHAHIAILMLCCYQVETQRRFQFMFLPLLCHKPCRPSPTSS